MGRGEPVGNVAEGNKMNNTRGIALCLSAALLSACQQEAVNETGALTTVAAPAPVRSAQIPGPRTCFWARGPHGADPYINIAYPDANVYYWAASFTTPEGAELRLEGEYPHARYMSFVSYDERGRPVESLPDYLIEPGSVQPAPHATENDAGDARAPGGENPFVPGSRRDREDRSYSIQIVNAAPTTEYAVGERSEASSGNILHTPAYGTARQQAVLYRIYLPDAETAPDGAAPLPSPVLTLADGRELRGEDACAALKTRQPIAITPNAVGVPPSEYRKLINQPGRPDTWPAQVPAEWFIQLDRKSLLGIYTGYINPDAKRSVGGFYPNLDNHYIRTVVNRKHGPVFMVRAKAPTTPKTYRGEAVMGDGELRYWSICSNQGFANTRVNDCLFDEEIPVDRNGFYTVVVSREEDRPRNAVPACGIGWLPMAEDGDGLFDDDVTIVQIRHMLTAPDFKHSVQRVERQDDLVKIMGPYMPQTRYALPNQIEAFFPCFN